MAQRSGKINEEECDAHKEYCCQYYSDSSKHNLLGFFFICNTCAMVGGIFSYDVMVLTFLCVVMFVGKHHGA